MSQQAPSSPGSATRPAHGWPDALAAVLAGLAVMAVCAALGLWAAGAADLPVGGFLPVVAALTVCLLVRLHAHYGLSLLGIGDLGGDLAGEVALRPHLWQALGLSAVWGLVTGLIGGLLASRARRRGQPVPRSR